MSGTSDASAVPRVTVVVPTYNRADDLPQAVDSLLNQTCDDWEMVIVDDASSDDTFEVGAAYAARHPEKITAFKLERNLGIGGARSAAIAASRGSELIVLLDSDDYLRSDYVEHLLSVYDQAVAAGRRIGIIACNGYIHTPEGVTGETFAERFWWSDEIDVDRMLERNYILARAMFTRTAYNEVGEFSSECLGYDDYDMWLRILEAGYEVATTREPVAYYRVSPAGASRDQAFMTRGGMTALSRVLERSAVTPAQRRTVKARLRHFRALRARALFLDAVKRRQPLQAMLRGLEAAPTGLVAFLQHPSRWREWAGDIRRTARHRAGVGRNTLS